MFNFVVVSYAHTVNKKVCCEFIQCIHNRRFTQTAKIIKCDHDGLEHICSRDKVRSKMCSTFYTCTTHQDALNLYELFHTRNLLHRTVYWHKTVAVIQEMLACKQ